MCFKKKKVEEVHREICVPEWQAKIDKFILEQEVVEALRLDEEKKARIAHLGEKFSCHICGRKSEKPMISIEKHQSRHVGKRYIGIVSHTDWEKPGDLHECNNCDKWTCEDHLYKGICMTCAEKL